MDLGRALSQPAVQPLRPQPAAPSFAAPTGPAPALPPKDLPAHNTDYVGAKHVGHGPPLPAVKVGSNTEHGAFS
ncbi:hypothetical protein CALVIDRAFT_543293 [Calocera viscosa TUFC12733]|uniref:Uncharacterized protein n=1 Tax=Calocera viscosa (strain TUFC12733) TaxID=1330018 RepID=A0A167FRF1_CALVF|nr:hypothetical protein CALVIDRAFT_543293 [Calocera viscosa TUFC12733]